MKLIQFFLSLLSLVVYVESETCLTTGGKIVTKPCQFPFFHKNTWSEGCKEREKSPGTFWCSTKVYKNGTHVRGEWGICGESCRKHGDVIKGDTPCQGAETCMSRYQCPLFQTLLKITDKSSQEYKTITNKLSKNVCNWKEKRLCCENTIDEPAQQQLSNNQFPKACARIDEGQTFSGLSLPRKGECGVKCNPLSTVIGGENADLGEFPWAALLGYTIRKKVYDGLIQDWVVRKTIGWKCGGTLINSWYVLTAAHCMDGVNRKRLKKVRLGELVVGTDPDCPRLEGQRDSLSGCLPGVQEHDVDRVIVHESYTPYLEESEGIFFDIALIRMKTEAVLNQAVQFACLPIDISEWADDIGASNFGDDLVGQNATVIGWGQVANYAAGDLAILGVSEKHLQKLDIPVVSKEECSRLYGEKGLRITEDHICAGGQVGKDSCKGDSGGGLFIRANANARQDSMRPFVEIGLVSYGSRPCAKTSPGVYTKVLQFIDWIQNKLEP